MKNKLIKSALGLAFCISSASANNQDTSNLDNYLKSIKTSGELRLAYLKNDNKSQDTSATALGGVIKFVLPTFKSKIQFSRLLFKRIK